MQIKIIKLIFGVQYRPIDNNRAKDKNYETTFYVRILAYLVPYRRGIALGIMIGPCGVRALRNGGGERNRKKPTLNLFSIIIDPAFYREMN